jgi:hypothetical protein
VQAGTAWAAGLAALTLGGLAALGLAAWRGRGPVGALVAGAALLFVCYGAWHVVIFVNEMR